MRKAANILWLGIKELRSFGHDFFLVAFVVWSFSFAILSQSKGHLQEVYNASVGIVDEDHSALSRQIGHAFMPPEFKTPISIAEHDVDHLMNTGQLTFVIDIPPYFERDLLGGRQPKIQLIVDATAMTQAGVGSGYAEQIINDEITRFLSRAEPAASTGVALDVRVAFNPNSDPSWFVSVMGIINNTNILAIMLAGAALVREREHGTMDHLLVMPLTPFEIADIQNMGQRARDHGRGCLVVIFRRPRADPRSHRRVNSAVPGGCRALSFFHNVDWNLSGHSRTLDAAARAAAYSHRLADEHAVGSEHADRQHADGVARHHGSVALHSLCLDCAGHSVSRRRHRRRMAALRCCCRFRRSVPVSCGPEVSLGRRPIDLIGSNAARHDEPSCGFVPVKTYR